MLKKKNSKYHVPNLERALDILELLAKHPAGLTVADITKTLQISRNSVFRITATLINHEYLLRDEETKALLLSQKLLSMGYSALGEETLVEKALESMRSLRNRYGETVPLGVLHGNEGVVVEEIPGTHPFRFVLAPGKPFHLHTSAPGKAMVAFLQEEERETLMNKIEYKKFNKNTITNIDDYRKRLEDVKKKGYAIDFAEEIQGMHCVAAPIFNRRGYPIAAIWITGPSFRVEAANFESIGKEVKKYADIISQSLGYGLLKGA